MRPHSTVLHDPRNDSNAPITRCSAQGLVAIYNMLPPSVVVAKSVLAFQRSLQECVVKFEEEKISTQAFVRCSVPWVARLPPLADEKSRD